MNTICFFCGNISWNGGTERVSSAVANYLSKNGYRIIILSLSGNGKSHFFLNEDIESFSLFKDKLPFKLIYPLVLFRLRKFIKKQQVDCLIDVDTILSMYSIPVTLFYRVKHISWEHFNFNVDFGMMSRKVSRYLAARYSNAVVTLTEKDKYYWEKNLPCKAKISAIYNPIPIEFEKVKISNPNSKQVLALGRLTHQKGFDYLLKIWKLVEENNKVWKLVIVGDGEDKDKLNKLRQELKLENVTILPATSEVHELYSLSSIYVMTSRFEGFPMVLLEASAYGLPIVSFDCDTGPNELLVDGVTGILVEGANEKKFANQLIHLMTEDALRVSMRKAALSEKNKYKIESIGVLWLSLLSDI